MSTCQDHAPEAFEMLQRAESTRPHAIHMGLSLVSARAPVAPRVAGPAALLMLDRFSRGAPRGLTSTVLRI